MTRRSAIYNHAAALSAQCDSDYELYLLHWLDAAEAACRNQLVNRKGRARGVTHAEMVCGPGHHMKRKAYATREFQDHLAGHPLLTRDQYEAQWLQGYLGGMEQTA